MNNFPFVLIALVGTFATILYILSRYESFFEPVLSIREMNNIGKEQVGREKREEEFRRAIVRANREFEAMSKKILSESELEQAFHHASEFLQQMARIRQAELRQMERTRQAELETLQRFMEIEEEENRARQASLDALFRSSQANRGSSRKNAVDASQSSR